MWAPNTKRKREEEPDSQSYYSQRQSILDISMIKLRSQPVRNTEQPLRRSVLIFNTLKNIESELTEEGVRWNPASRPSLLPSIQESDMTLDPIPANDSKPVGGGEKHAAMDTTCRSPLALPTTTPPETMTAPPTESAYTGSILDSLFNLPVSQTGPLPTFSSLLDLDSSTPTTTMDSTGFTSSSLSSLSSSPTLPIATTSSSNHQHSTARSSSHHLLSSSDQDLFNDFDFSSLDVDFFSFLPSNLKLPPLSAEDLQSLQHSDTFSQRQTSCNPKHSDLLGDDLDSIMQILVGM